ncbi:MAG TPA: hypothetical protein VLK84_20040 [Longimicrobium sp.]|nr:hypothetical protein [Longimicrobium sp.]
MTAAEFDRRAAAAESYINRALAWLFGPAGVASVVMMAWLLGAKQVPEWLGNASVIATMGFSLAGLVAGVVRENRAASRFGLLCPGCGMALPGGKTNENTIHVRKTGCCSYCAAPVLRDHPGAAEAAAREATLPRAVPHASAFSRGDFDRRLARLRQRTGRRINLVIGLGLGGMPAIASLIFLPLPHAIKVKIMSGGMLLLPVVLIGAMLGGRSTWRQVGLECPACRRNPLKGRDLSVVRTGICPHCSAVIIRPAA